MPRSWADLLKPEYKGEIQVANPASSGTAYTMVATLVQLMGEDKAFDYLKALHKNVSQYTRSGTGPIKAVARGETAVSISFVHDGPGEKLQGFPVETVTPLGGHRRRDRLDEHHQGRAQPRQRQEVLRLGADAAGAADRRRDAPVPAAVEQGHAGRPARAGLQEDPLIDYDYAKYGASAERRRLIAQWEKDVNSLPR